MLKTELIEDIKSDFSMIVSLFSVIHDKFEQYIKLDEKIDQQNNSEMLRLKKLIPNRLNQKTLNKQKEPSKPVVEKPILEPIVPKFIKTISKQKKNQLKSNFKTKESIKLDNPSIELINEIFNKISRNSNKINECDLELLAKFDIEVKLRDNGYYEINSLSASVIKNKKELDEIYNNLPTISIKNDYSDSRRYALLMQYFTFCGNYNCILLRCKQGILKLVKL